MSDDMYTTLTVASVNPALIDLPPVEEVQALFENMVGPLEEPFDLVVISDAVHYAAASWSKYQLEGLPDFAVKLTDTYRGVSITIREEWTGEGGPDITERTYLFGERLAKVDRVTKLVPKNLQSLVSLARMQVEALTHLPAHQTQHIRALLEALRDIT